MHLQTRFTFHVVRVIYLLTTNRQIVILLLNNSLLELFYFDSTSKNVEKQNLAFKNPNISPCTPIALQLF